ncbi:MAG: thioredoxin-like domain-containing protein, partial [Myxococcota bacterium]
MHLLPVLRQLEERFASEPFVVLGVHSAKFTTEKDPSTVRKAMERHGLRHPVVIDSDLRIWRQYAVRAWPTLVLIDAQGRIARKDAGEADLESLARAVRELLDEARSGGTLAARKRDPAAPAADEGRELRFPGKVRAADGKLFIADTGH